MTVCDILIVGAGPAGMAAGLQAAHLGASVIVLDEQPVPGGQIYRNVDQSSPERLAVLGLDYAAGRALTQNMSASTLQHITNAAVWSVQTDGTVTYSVAGQARQVRGERLILATGALERPIPIPGWTLPGATTAGAAQILMKTSGLVAEDAVLVGCGPLLYLVAAQMIATGNPPRALVETQSFNDVLGGLRHAGGMLRGREALTKGAGLLASIRRAGVKRYTGAREIAVNGDQAVTGVTFQAAGKSQTIPSTQALLHIGVVPNIQITQSLQVDHRWKDDQNCFHPVLDAWGQTTQSGIYVAGDGAAIGGAKAAEYAGRLAAIGALCDLGRIEITIRDSLARPLRRKLNRELAIRPFLDAVYAPPAEILSPKDETIVCRCEEVTAGDIRRYAKLGCQGPNQTKAFGRSGMGPCQGRYCGLAVTAILAQANGQTPDETGYYRIRTPLKPISLGELASLDEGQNQESAPNN